MIIPIAGMRKHVIRKLRRQPKCIWVFGTTCMDAWCRVMNEHVRFVFVYLFDLMTALVVSQPIQRERSLSGLSEMDGTGIGCRPRCARGGVTTDESSKLTSRTDASTTQVVWKKNRTGPTRDRRGKARTRHKRQR